MPRISGHWSRSSADRIALLQHSSFQRRSTSIGAWCISLNVRGIARVQWPTRVATLYSWCSQHSKQNLFWNAVGFKMKLAHFFFVRNFSVQTTQTLMSCTHAMHLHARSRCRTVMKLHFVCSYEINERKNEEKDVFGSSTFFLDSITLILCQ